MEVNIDFADLIKSNMEVLVGDDLKLVTLMQIRQAAAGLLVHVDGVNDREAAALFRNQYVFTPLDKVRQQKPGMIFTHEIIGMQVEDVFGNLLGVIEEVLKTGANDVYVVKSDQGNELLIPAIKSVIMEIDPEKKKMVIQPQEWL